MIGWGGEWASQVAGATSGAAPLVYLYRLPPEDRDAALALRDETAAARRA